MVRTIKTDPWWSIRNQFAILKEISDFAKVNKLKCIFVNDLKK